MRPSIWVAPACRALLVLLILASIPLSAMALEPPTLAEREKMRRDGTLQERIAAAYALGNHRVGPWLLHQARQRLCQAMGDPSSGETLMSVPSGRRGLPTKGTVQVLALLIDFQDIHHISYDTPDSIKDKLFGLGIPENFPYESLMSYYQRSSYNQLNIQGDVLGWYTAPYSRSNVTQNYQGRENLIKEAMQYYADQGFDFSKYDNDSDGVIDYFMVFWAGGHGDWASFWWGYKTNFSDSTFKLNGKQLHTYSWQWESRGYPAGVFSPSTVIHETGHALGLPDYYDYDNAVGPRGGVGGLDMMDSAAYDHNCFSKFLLDWLTPTVYRARASGISLPAAANVPEAILLLPRDAPSTPFTEYFMVQNRLPAGNDQSLFNAGLLVWHVDANLNPTGSDFLYDNSYTEHKLLKLMEADGLELIEQGQQANYSDFYMSNNSFGPATRPNSSRYYGGPTGLGINNISPTFDPITCDVFDVYDDLTPPTGHPAAPAGTIDPANPSGVVFTWVAGNEADPESGIGGYRLQVGTTAGGNDRFDDILSLTLAKSISDAENGKTYFARVAAVNGNRLIGEWSSSSPGVTVTLPTLSGAAAEAPTLAFTNSSSVPWFEEATIGHTGSSALQSGAIGNNRTSAIYTSINGPSRLAFYLKVSSEGNFDFLYVYVDGQVAAALSGEIDWVEQVVELPVGPHLVKWAYVKDPAVSAGLDSVWLDGISITPLEKPGDLDQSTVLNSLDAVVLELYMAGSVHQGTAPFLAPLDKADLNQDGKVDDADLAILKDYLAGNRRSAAED